MSCIATIYLTTDEKYNSLLDFAKKVKTENTGWWIFKKRKIIGKSEFDSAFNHLLKEETTFDYSGFSMLDIEEIGFNNPEYSVPVNASDNKDLETIFGYGGYLFRSPQTLKIPTDELITKHLKDKNQDFRSEAVNIVRSAYEFYNSAAELTRNGNITLIGLY